MGADTGQKSVVAILGASPKPDRFAYRAMKLLAQHGHTTLLVNPQVKEIEGLPVYKSLGDVKTPIDTLTMYVGPKISDTLGADILGAHPKRVIFNPGSENPALEAKLKAAGIKVVEDCTLVMLNAGEF